MRRLFRSLKLAKSVMGIGARCAAAEVLALLGTTGLARRLLQKTLARAVGKGNRSDIAAVYSAQAFVEGRAGNKMLAIECLKTAIEKESEARQAWLYHCDLAMLYKMQGNYALAISHFTEGVRLLEPDVSPEFRVQIEAELQECRQKMAGAGS